MSLKYEPASELLHILMNGDILVRLVQEIINHKTSMTTYQDPLHLLGGSEGLAFYHALPVVVAGRRHRHEHPPYDVLVQDV